MLYIHVGSHKTGTTSIQSSLFASRDHLRRHGVDYFSYAANHSEAMLWRFSSQRLTHPTSVNARLSEDDLNRMAADVDRELRAFLADTAYSTKIISGEELSTFRPSDIEKLKEFLAPFQAPTRIIIYVRNYYEYLNSELQELVKWGWTLTDLEADITNGRGIQPNYRYRIQKFIDLFGKENVDVRIFHPDRLQGGDLLHDFCYAVGAAAAFEGLKKSVVNASMSEAATRLLSDYNARFPITIGGRYNLARVETAKAHFQQINGPKFCMRNAGVLAAYEASIQDDGAYMRTLLGRDAKVYLMAHDASEEPGESKFDEDRTRYDRLMDIFGSVMQGLESYKLSVDLALRLLPAKTIGPADTSFAESGFRLLNADSLCRRLGRALLREGRVRLAKLAAERAMQIDSGNFDNRQLLKDTSEALSAHVASR